MCVTCATGYKWIDLHSWCTTDCPTGYPESGNDCTATFIKVMEYSFTSFSPIFYDAISSVPGVRGYSSEPEDADPLVVYLRGYYFDGIDDVV